MSYAAIIVAAGNSTRMGEGAVPKPYLELGGKAVLRHSIDILLNHRDIETVQVVINPIHVSLYEKAVAGLDLPPPVLGGQTRGESVLSGLEVVSADYVLIHDAARPFLNNSVIDCLIDALESGAEGVIPVLPVADTLKYVDGGLAQKTLDRSKITRIQTPQAFRREKLIMAYKNYGTAETDDAALFEKADIAVNCIAGEEDLFKITTYGDLKRAKFMSAGRICIGQGYDVHRLIDGEVIILGGVKIPFNRKLEGHSDADVVLHALADALLGAAGLGDIGLHFSPNDPQWKNADSRLLLKKVVGWIQGKGYVINNVDATIICEAPKISPYRADIRDQIAYLLEIEPGFVNVKATTTEGLGFTGRGEGVAAQAIVSLIR